MVDKTKEHKEHKDNECIERYLYLIRYSERIHRKLLDVIRFEMDRKGYHDVSSVQALIIFNVGESVSTPSELKIRGHYLGSNISYNIKKLVSLGYIEQKQSSVDKRSTIVLLSSKGKKIYNLVRKFLEKQGVDFARSYHLTSKDLRFVSDIMSSLEKFWEDYIDDQLNFWTSGSF